MSETNSSVRSAEALRRLCGDTPAGRMLAAALTQLALGCLVYGGVRFVLARIGTQGEPAGGIWLELASYLSAALFAAGLLWMGFVIAVALRARGGDAALFALPTALAFAFASVVLVEGNAAALLTRLSNGGTAGPTVAFLAARTALVIGLIVTLAPAMPVLLNAARDAARNARAAANVRSAAALEAARAGHNGADSDVSRSSGGDLGRVPTALSSTATIARRAHAATAAAPAPGRFCGGCGADLVATARFCRHCGRSRE